MTDEQEAEIVKRIETLEKAFKVEHCVHDFPVAGGLCRNGCGLYWAPFVT